MTGNLSVVDAVPKSAASVFFAHIVSRAPVFETWLLYCLSEYQTGRGGLSADFERQYLYEALELIHQ